MSKRKHEHIAVSELERLIETVDSSTSLEEAVKAVKTIRALIEVTKQRKTENKLQTIQAFSLDLEEVVHLTGIRYRYGDEDFSWSLPDDLDRVAEVSHACGWLETALEQFRKSNYWHSSSAEALRRTPIDMILFDRLSLKQDVVAARNLVLKGERPIMTTCLDETRGIAGIADYVVGYGYAPGRENNANLESTYIVIEAKKAATMPKGRAQVAAYLVGIQQQCRLAGKIVMTVYGVVTDGVAYEFLRLDDSLRLQVSRQYLTTYESERKEVYRYLDAILDAAISCSPHTTSSKPFPDHHAKWSHSVERKLFNLPQEVKDHLPEDWERYLVECSDDDCEEAWEAVRSDTPSHSNVTLRPSKTKEPTDLDS